MKVRMEEEAAASLEIEGGSNCGQFVAGHQFTLKRHFDADGQYALTHVQHDAHLEHREKSPKRAISCFSPRLPALNLDGSLVPFTRSARPSMLPLYAIAN